MGRTWMQLKSEDKRKERSDHSGKQAILWPWLAWFFLLLGKKYMQGESMLLFLSRMCLISRVNGVELICLNLITNHSSIAEPTNGDPQQFIPTPPPTHTYPCDTSISIKMLAPPPQRRGNITYLYNTITEYYWCTIDTRSLVWETYSLLLNTLIICHLDTPI